MYIKQKFLKTLLDFYRDEAEDVQFLDFKLEYVAYGMHDMMEVGFEHFKIIFNESDGEVVGFDVVLVDNNASVPEILEMIQNFFDNVTMDNQP